MDMSQFDDNILQEILSRLPVKTLMQLKCMCRRWNDLISSSLFVKTQVTRSIDNVPGLLSTTAHYSGGLLTYFPIDRGINACNIPLILNIILDRICMKAACNGLIFCQINDSTGVRYKLGSLSTDSFNWVPKPLTNANDARFGLAFDPFMSPTSLKIVACDRTQFSMYSPKANTWRVSSAQIDFDYKDLFDNVSSVFFNGALHWLQKKGNIVAFNVEEERSYKMKLPDGVEARAVAGYSDVWMGVAKGRMSVVKLDNEGINVWEMKDYSSEKWEFKKYIVMRKGKGRCYYKKNVPLFYDGARCVLLTWERGESFECGLAVYRIGDMRWDRIQKLEGWMDCSRNFFPYISHLQSDFNFFPPRKGIN